MRYFLFCILCTFCVVSGVSQASELQGVGMFQTLDTPWFVVALYNRTEEPDSTAAAVPEKLEFKVLEDEISIRRYRKLWQDVFAVAQEQEAWERYASDLQTFFQIVKGPLQSNDLLVIEQKPQATVISINYREHASLSADFLPLLVNTLTARIAPVPILRAGLLGQLPAEQYRDIMRQFDRGEPTLKRISETGRWLRHKQSQPAAQLSSARAPLNYSEV